MRPPLKRPATALEQPIDLCAEPAALFALGRVWQSAFTAILIASALSSVGIAMFDTSMSWLMTRLNPNPLMVSAVQVATMAPMFLLTVPAGALTDVADPRRLLITAQFGVVAVGAVFASFVTVHWATRRRCSPRNSCSAPSAAHGAGWQTITPMLVPKSELDSAIAFNSASYNISRALGPALGGIAISAISIMLPFWFFVNQSDPARRARLVAGAAQGAGDAAGRAACQRDEHGPALREEQPRPRRYADPGARVLSLRQRLLGADAAHRPQSIAAPPSCTAS